MIKKAIRRICRISITCLFIILAIAMLLTVRFLAENKAIIRIRHYAKTHTEFTLADALGDGWDVAYHDGRSYSTGELVAEKYGFQYNGTAFSSEEYHRIFFIKNGKLQRVTEYNRFLDLSLPYDLEVITPQTVFHARWDNGLLWLEPVTAQKNDTVAADPNETKSHSQPQTDIPASSTSASSVEIPPCEKVSYQKDPVGCIQYFLWQKACEYQEAGLADDFKGQRPPWNFVLGIADINADGVPELLFHDIGPGSKVYKLWLYDISGEEPTSVGCFNVGGCVTEVCQARTEDGLPHYRISSCWGNSTSTGYTTAFIRALPDGGFDIWECESLYNEMDGPQDTQGWAVRHNGEPAEDSERTISNALFAQPMTPCSGWFCRTSGFSVNPEVRTGVIVDPECTDPWWQSYAKAAVELYYS